MQTRKNSIVETLVNVGIGFTVGVLSNYFVLPLFGYDVPISDSMSIAVAFTLIAIVRSYLVRRLFNRLESYERKNI